MTADNVQKPDWGAILGTHPVFASLTSVERDALLQPENSIEKRYPEDARIVRQGELGHAVYLMGEGSASVTMRRGGGDETELYSIGFGELFGEMALIEERPRAASVVASSPCSVREIRGEVFVEMLRTKPEFAFRLLGRLSRRLRFTNTKVMEQRISSLDETVNMVNARIDMMIAKTESHLSASKVIFEQTKQSAHEVIENSERKQALLTRVGTIGALILTIAASFGFWDMRQLSSSIGNQRVEIERQISETKSELANLEDARDTALASVEELGKTVTDIEDLKDRAAVELANLQGDRQTAIDSVAALEAELSDLRDRVDAIKDIED
ncbi:MAG: cyclic nucleotide-binding domain-containing protein [Pseudomonadota bacterium]